MKRKGGERGQQTNLLGKSPFYNHKVALQRCQSPLINIILLSAAANSMFSSPQCVEVLPLLVAYRNTATRANHHILLVHTESTESSAVSSNASGSVREAQKRVR